MRKLSVFIMIAFIILMSSCSKYEGWKDYVDASNETERTYANSADNSAFTYVSGDTGNFEFRYGGDISPHDLDSVISDFFTFTSSSLSDETSLPGADFIRESGVKLIVLRIFIDDELLFYESYDLSGNTLKVYENTFLDYNGRLTDDESHFADYGDVKVLDLLVPFTRMIRVESGDELSEDKLSLLVDLTESYASAVEDAELKKYGINTELGFILSIAGKDEIHFERTYYNGIEKEWLDIDWMNYGFFREYSRGY